MTTHRGTGEHLVVDWTRCDGHGLCAELSGGAIALDDWGFPILPGAPAQAAPARNAAADTPLDTKTQRRIVSLCPSLALRLEQKPTPRPQENTMTRPPNGAVR